MATVPTMARPSAPPTCMTWLLNPEASPASAIGISDIEIVKGAEAAGIVIRNLPDGWLRASIGWWTDEGDIDRLLEFLRVRA